MMMFIIFVWQEREVFSFSVWLEETFPLTLSLTHLHLVSSSTYFQYIQKPMEKFFSSARFMMLMSFLKQGPILRMTNC